jgi:hypothetical protein
MHLGRPEAPQVLNFKSFVDWSFACIKGSEAPALHLGVNATVSIS